MAAPAVGGQLMTLQPLGGVEGFAPRVADYYTARLGAGTPPVGGVRPPFAPPPRAAAMDPAQAIRI